MLIPEYWAESTTVVTKGDRRVTLRRFGWSNENQNAAQRHANERLEQAVTDWELNPSIPRRERKTAYNGSDGVPIREEIIDSNDDYVITRNAYGALCLNTENVLIADVDRAEGAFEVGCLIAVLLGITALFVGLGGFYWLAVALVVLSIATASITQYYSKRYQDTSHKKQLQKFEGFSKDNPVWGLRVYETPLGFRLIATHRTFDPQSAEVTDFFRTVGADKVYAQMCLRQNCFRARLTAKPWRCGINDPMLPRGVWPIKKELLSVRQTWVERYQASAVNYAACRLLRTLGPEAIAPQVERVVSVHDKLTQSHTELPLA
ncbi:MAG: hypothetical protein MUC83_04575 [Pirellula sp.]|jgi:hypothetical protein|nr:hypothetical protein [Pirellula sp.]